MLDEKHKWHTKFPWWIGPFTEINWIDAKDPTGAENCSAMDENPFRAEELRAAKIISIMHKACKDVLTGRVYPS